MDNIDVLMESLKEQTTVYDESTKQYVAKSQGNSLHKVVVYYFIRRDQLRVFLTNPQVTSDSNITKRCMRAVAVLEDVSKFKQSPEYIDLLYAVCDLRSLRHQQSGEAARRVRARVLHSPRRPNAGLIWCLLSKKICNFKVDDSAKEFPLDTQPSPA